MLLVLPVQLRNAAEHSHNFLHAVELPYFCARQEYGNRSRIGAGFRKLPWLNDGNFTATYYGNLCDNWMRSYSWEEKKLSAASSHPGKFLKASPASLSFNPS